jgi:kumamolisin
MRLSIFRFGIIALVVLAFALSAAAQNSSVNSHVMAVPGKVPGVAVRLPLFIYIPDDGRIGHPDPLPGSETPSSIACIYGVTAKTPGCPRKGTVLATGGSGAIAVVEFGTNSTMQSDFNTFNAAFGLPAATVTEICALGPGNCPVNDGTGWDVETALDIQYAHAMAPNAQIFIAEFASDPLSDGTETAAANAVAGVGHGEVSNSWGYSSEPSNERSHDHLFVHTGVVFFASAGDDGAGVQYPSTSPNVVSAGGTSIVRNSGGAYQTQDGWSGSGGGPSTIEPRPSYQNVIESIVGNFRGTPDLSADSDPNTGVAIYNTTGCGGWCQVGGTSVASPTLAGITNAAGSFNTSTKSELLKLYKEYADPTEYQGRFLDITVGGNGYSCEVGWDYCSGIGAPKKLSGE